VARYRAVASSCAKYPLQQYTSVRQEIFVATLHDAQAGLPLVSDRAGRAF